MRLRHLCEKLVIRDSGKVKKSARFQSMNFPFFISSSLSSFVVGSSSVRRVFMQTWCTAPFQISFSTTVLFATTTTKETIRSLSGGGGIPAADRSITKRVILIRWQPHHHLPRKKNRKEKQQKKKHFRFFNHRIIPPINGGALYERDSAQGLIIILRSYMYVYKLSYREREREGDKVQVAHIVGKAKFHWAYRFPTSSS